MPSVQTSNTFIERQLSYRAKAGAALVAALTCAAESDVLMQRAAHFEQQANAYRAAQGLLRT